MKLVISNCRSCGHEMYSFGKLSVGVKCPKCGSTILEYIGEKDSSVEPEDYVPFNSDKAMFLNAIGKFVISGNWPVDILEHLDPKRIQAFYLPAYYYTGNMEAQWSCELAESVNMNMTVNKKKIDIKEGAKLQGVVRDVNFYLYGPAPSPSTSGVKEWQDRMFGLYSTNYGQNPLSELEGNSEVMTFDFNTSPLSVWAEHGNSIMDNLAKIQAELNLRDMPTFYQALGVFTPDEADFIRKSFQGSSSLKEPAHSFKNWKIFSRSNITGTDPGVLIPAWYLPYEYEGTKGAYFAIVAIPGAPMAFAAPTSVVNSSASVPPSTEVIEAQKYYKFAKWAGWLSLLLLFFMGFKVGIGYFILWLIAYFIMKNKVSDATKRADALNQANAQATINRLLSQI